MPLIIATGFDIEQQNGIVNSQKITIILEDVLNQSIK
jgi:hypothetical protein